MTVKEQMLKAQALIKQKKYAEARAILEEVEHPKAREWLVRINKISPVKTSSSKTQKEKSSRSSNRNILIGGAILLVIIILAIAGIFVVPNFLNNDTPAESDIAENVEQTTDNQDDTDTDNNPVEQNTNETAAQVASSSGMTVSFVSGGFLVTVDVPQGWLCNCDLSSGNLEQEDDSRNRIGMRVMSSTFEPDALVGVPLEDVLNEDIDDDETIAFLETLDANGRELLHATIADEDGDEDQRYYVADNEGQVARFEISSRIEQPESLQEIVLLVAGTIQIDHPDTATEFIAQVLNNSLAYNETLNRWRVPDFVNNEYEQIVELPADWAIESVVIGIPMAVKSDSQETSATAISVIPSFYYDSENLADIAVEMNRGASDTIENAETLSVNGREVYVFTGRDPAGSETRSYLVFDSEDDLIVLIIQAQVSDKDSLHEDVLFMAGNIESEETDYLTRLARAGLIDAPVADDGYVPLAETP